MVFDSLSELKILPPIKGHHHNNKMQLTEGGRNQHTNWTMDSVKSEWKPMFMTNKCSDESVPVSQRLRHRANGCITGRTLARRFPISKWLPNYKLSYLQHDLVAGITVALTVIPQGIAYANLAGLPLQYGLYTSFMGLFTYCLLGTMRMIHIGPTSMMAILILDHVLVGGPAYAIWLSFLSGCVEILLGVFRMGTLVDFISLPVASGFSSAASVIVIVNLLKSIFGLKFSSSSFLDLVYKLGQHLPETNRWDLILGLICILSLLVLKKLNEIVKRLTKSQKMFPLWQRFMLSLFWFLLTARNALVVLVAAIVAYALVNMDLKLLTLSADVAPGLPEFNFPPLHLERDGETFGFFKICQELEWGIALVPLVAILQHIAIAKSFAGDGKAVDATQEVITLGICNVLGSFFGAFPVTASFSRTALNVTSGIKTTLASAFTGVLVLVALGVLAPTFKYIPKATLAAVIINAVYSMIEYEMIPQLWKTKRSDLAIWLITFTGCLLLEAEYGILTGIFFSLLLLLYNTAKPRITLVMCQIVADREVIVVEPDRAMYFPSVEHTRHKVNKKMRKGGRSIPVILDGSHICGADYTAAQGFKRLIEDVKRKNGIVIFTNFKEKVLNVIKSIDPTDFIYCETVDEINMAVQAFYSQMSNVTKKSNGNDSNEECDDSSNSSSSGASSSSESSASSSGQGHHSKLHRPTLHHNNSECAILLPDTPDVSLSSEQPKFQV